MLLWNLILYHNDCVEAFTPNSQSNLEEFSYQPWNYRERGDKRESLDEKTVDKDTTKNKRWVVYHHIRNKVYQFVFM